MRIRIMTFNVENLFQRLLPGGEAEVARRLGVVGAEAGDAVAARAAALLLDDEERTLGALAIRAGRPDIVLLQEVGGVAALARFHDLYLTPLGVPALPYRAVLEGNDPRGLCVGVMSRLPLDGLVSHRHLALGSLFEAGFHFESYGIRHRSVVHDKLFSAPDTPVFCRDCLEVRLEVDGRPLLLFAVHFKAPLPGRPHTYMARLAESAGVVHLLRQRAQGRGLERWIVAGDLNDYHHIEGVADEGHGLGPLLESGLVVDPMERLDDPAERWTHYGSEEEAYRQLDYLLLSPELARSNPAARPEVIRAGQPWRAERVTGPRFPRVGWDAPRASDHCPVVIELEV